MGFFEQVGTVALGTRVRLLAETMTQDAAQIYKAYGNAVNPKWFPVLHVLARGGDRTITSIAAEIGHSHASISKIVAEMARAGVLVERADRRDRRRTLARLSGKGRQIARKIRQPQCTDVATVVEEIAAQCTHDLWQALGEWEYLLAQKSLLARVLEKKKQRESAAVKIEPYQARYRRAFRTLNEEWIRTHFKMEQADRDTLADPQGRVIDRGGCVLVATVDGRAVGVCALLRHDDPLYPYELAKMAVAPRMRGRNIGYLLAKAAIDKARALGAPRLFLESNTVLTPAIKLYEKLGFKKTAGLPSPYARCNIQMALELWE
jgi:GNAT superfamily N-acetyltransferase/predicted transcriptional regulator